MKTIGDHRDLHNLRHSFPTRRSSDLTGKRKYFDLIGRVLRFALVVGVIAALLFVVERLVLR
jgi:hypothetical protein